MPPQIALLLTLILIGYLLRREARQEPRLSRAVWIPTIWLMISGSRQVSQWFGGDPSMSTTFLEDGNPVDRAIFGTLILVGVAILASRRVRLGEIFRNNRWIILFFLYEGLSVLWSDFPMSSFRKWSKSLGDPIMVLVLWSDQFPVRAVIATIKRCAYVLVPLSILFTKYYDNLGRSFDRWGGGGYTGVTTNKNMLGYLLFAFGLFFLASVVSQLGRNRHDDRVAVDQAINLLFLVMIGWLLLIADAQTATLALSVGVLVMAATRLSVVRRHFWASALAATVLVVVAEALFSVTGVLVSAAGRDLTFTGRTGLWETVLDEPINWLIGVGYASFWLGERLARFWAMYPTSPPIQAHNGYLEVYLNLGLIGLCLVTGLLGSGLRRIRNREATSLAAAQTADDRLLTMFGLPFGIAYLFYNITEATFQGVNFLFVVFLILAFGYRHAPPSNEPRPERIKPPALRQKRGEQQQRSRWTR